LSVETQARLTVVMGTTGCGKSTVGAALATQLDALYLEGDDYHSPENKQKMSGGVALEDEDRWPWLQSLGQAMANQKGPVVASCSSLKRSYRDYISNAAAERVLFVHLYGSKELIASRLADRKDHFMDKKLLDSQVATLELLDEGESGFTVEIDQSVDQIVRDIVSQLRAYRFTK